MRDLKVREGRPGEHEERDDGALGVRKQKQAGVAGDTEQKGNGRTRGCWGERGPGWPRGTFWISSQVWWKGLEQGNAAI